MKVKTFQLKNGSIFPTSKKMFVKRLGEDEWEISDVKMENSFIVSPNYEIHDERFGITSLYKGKWEVTIGKKKKFIAVFTAMNKKEWDFKVLKIKKRLDKKFAAETKAMQRHGIPVCDPIEGFFPSNELNYHRISD